jgi:hypothetical protein
MASLYVEMAPGNWVFRVIDIAVKGPDAKPGAQIVEREFGMFEVHSLAQADVMRAGEVVLEELGLQISDRKKPEIASMQVITNVDAYQAQLLNRFTKGMMLVAGRRCWCSSASRRPTSTSRRTRPRKAAPVNLMHVTSVGRFGRLWMAGSEANIIAARDAAVTAIESIDGQPL